MSKLTVIAKLQAAEGKASEFESAINELVAAAAEESELEIYSAHRDPQNEGVFYFFELYTTRDSFSAHGKGPAMRAAMNALGPLMGAAPEVFLLDPVVAKGMQL